MAITILPKVVDGVTYCECNPVPPPECCLYPWPDPDGISGGPYYPTTDLPSAITETEGFYTGGVPETYNHDPGTYRFTAASGRYIIADPSTPDWFWYDASDSFLNKAGSCLIGAWAVGSTPMNIEDEFLDNYLVEFVHEGRNESVGVLRDQPDSLCNWHGAGGTLSYGVLVTYNSATYQFEATISIPSEGLSYGPTPKDDPQSSPDGTYSDVGPITNITAS